MLTLRLPLEPATCQALSGDIVAHETYAHVGHLAEDPAAPLDPPVRRRVLRGREIDAARHAPPLDEIDEDQIPLSRLTRFANYRDLCAISLPLPVGDLPVGLQLAAPAGADARLLALAEVVADRLDGTRRVGAHRPA